jgi:anti-sigma factor RsiW
MKKKCKYDHYIDRYLLDKLNPEDQAEFEEHYFICPHCFAKMDQQSEIVQILRKEGVLETGQESCGHAARPASWWRRLLAKLRRN